MPTINPDANDDDDEMIIEFGGSKTFVKPKVFEEKEKKTVPPSTPAPTTAVSTDTDNDYDMEIEYGGSRRISTPEMSDDEDQIPQSDLPVQAAQEYERDQIEEEEADNDTPTWKEILDEADKKLASEKKVEAKRDEEIGEEVPPAQTTSTYEDYQETSDYDFRNVYENPQGSYNIDFQFK